MDQYTKESPGCYHDMLRYMSDLSGLSVHKQIWLKKVTTPVKKKGNIKQQLIYKSYDISVHTKCGKVVSYMPEPHKRYDQLGYEAERFAVTVRRDAKEFGIPYHDAGTYKDSLGGGWYSKVPMFRVNDKYFASMECRCY